MEFLVEFEIEVLEGMRKSEIERRTRAESIAAAGLADEGHLLRIWIRDAIADDTTAIGLDRAGGASACLRLRPERIRRGRGRRARALGHDPTRVRTERFGPT
jgi:muconolactone delta-isomerase